MYKYHLCEIFPFILHSLLLFLANHFSTVHNVQTQTNCWSQRANVGHNDFVYECTDDGHFKPIQCDNKTGYCFCVDVDTGAPNGQVNTKDSHLDCNQSPFNILNQNQNTHQTQSNRHSNGRARSNQNRFTYPLNGISSSTQPIAAAQSQLIPNKKKRSRSKRCSTGQRISYVNRLVTKIEQSFIKQQQQRQNIARLPLGIQRHRSTPAPSNRIQFNPIIRQFNDYDMNNDHSLSNEEFQAMIDAIFSQSSEINHRSQLIYCADSMFDFCDRNHDMNVTRPEFIQCLNLKYTQALNEHYLQRRKQQKSHKGNSSINKSNRVKPENVFDNESSSPDNESTLSTSSIKFDDHISSIPLLMENTITVNQTVSGHSGKRHESRKDCNLIRANSIESARVNPHGLVFIPECMADGYYVRIQCHLMHCWCVSRVTGQPIKALNKNSTENLEACDLMRKGCDQRRRIKFHKHFRQRLSSLGYNCQNIFQQINIDINDHIEENEFKSFMRQWLPKLSLNNRLKKCLRTEIHYCDQNDDGQLTENEWIQCCNDNITVTNNILSLSKDKSMIQNHQHQLNAGRRDSGIFPGSNFFSVEFAEAYNQKKNRPRSGQNPLKILNSE